VPLRNYRYSLTHSLLSLRYTEPLISLILLVFWLLTCGRHCLHCSSALITAVKVSCQYLNCLLNDIVTDVLTLFSGDLLRWVLSEGGRHVVVWRGINQRQFMSFCEYQQHLSVVKVYSKLVSKNICILPEINVQWLTAKSISLSVTLSVCLSVCNCLLQWLHC